MMKQCVNRLLLGATLLFSACYPEPDTVKLIDDLAVATNFDPAADFTAYATYAIPTDTIGLVSNQTTDTILVYSETSFPRHVINAVKENLNSRGYQQVDRTASPDVGINLMVVNDLNFFQQIVYPGYGYPGNFYSGYYGYGGFYGYPYIDTYAYNTGVLVIEMVDLKNRTPDNKVKVVWDAYMGDIYSTLDLVPQTERAIDQAFAQSPFLKRN